MNVDDLREKVEYRLKHGESLDKVLKEYKDQGVPEGQINELMEEIMEDTPKVERKVSLLPIAIIFSSLIVIAVIILLTPLNPFASHIAVNLSDPIQEDYTGEQIIKNYYGQEFTLTPRAKYQGTFMIGGVEEYDDDAKFSKYDFVLLWGELADSHYDKHLKIEQRERQWFSEFQETGPYECDYIAFHGANTHMIPATNDIAVLFDSIKPKQLVSMEGYLVDVTTTLDGKQQEWKTSLTRGDGGLESCEIFYVEQIQTNFEK